jgi:hypothetical protein
MENLTLICRPEVPILAEVSYFLAVLLLGSGLGMWGERRYGKGCRKCRAIREMWGGPK